MWELVVGDIIMLEAGDRVPADCLLIEAIDFQVDEAFYHKDETKMVNKSIPSEDNLEENADPFLLAESLVMKGIGKAVVLAVGDLSQRNKVELLLNDSI